MAKVTQLDKQWHELMFLCEQESAYQAQRNHPKLLKLVTAQIDELAGQMGFGPQQTRSREFRAVRDGEHIVDIIRGA
jgi:hypothetical protein